MDKTEKKLDKPHDKRYKKLFSNKTHFLSLLKDCVKLDWTEQLTEKNLKMSNRSFILQDFSEKEADVVYEVKVGDKKIIFYVLLELQRKPDNTMPYRLMLYINEILREYFNRTEKNGRDNKSFTMPAVFPIVFYNGSDKWNIPLNLREIFDSYESFGEYVINFKYMLIDAKGYADEDLEKFTSRLLGVTLMLEKARNDVEFYEYIRKNAGEIKDFNINDTNIFNAMIKIIDMAYGYSRSERIKEIFEQNQTEEANGMLVDIIENAKKEKKELIKKGKMEKAIETAVNFLKMGISVEQVAQGTELTVEQVMKIKETIK